jgi:hypothetical protein
MLQTAPDTESSEDEMRPEDEVQPPEPGQAIASITSTPSVHQVNETETSEVIEGNNKKTALLAGVDPTEKAKQDAIFSYNVIDLVDLPLALKLTNPYNTRPVNKLKVRGLQKALLEEGFRVFSPENRIMIVISQSDVDPSCITMDSNPTVQPQPLLLKTCSLLKELTIIGGQHRREAALLIMSENTKRMELLQRDIASKSVESAKFDKQPPKTEEARRRKTVLESEIEELELELSRREKSKDVGRRWGVMLLDPGRSHLILLAYQRISTLIVTCSQNKREAPHPPGAK